MYKEENSLVCPSCYFEIRFDKNKFVCEKCVSQYNIKEGLPILINFNLENVLIKEEEIKIKSENLRNSKIKEKILNLIYGTSKVTKNNVTKFLKILEKNQHKKVLVIGGATKGSGTENLWNNKEIDITSIDIVGSRNIDYIADAHYLPFKNETFSAVWIQAVLEHVIYPEKVVREIFRVLQNGGIVYSEIPFMQQIHMGKNDFTRFSASGQRYLFKNFEKISLGINGGPGTSLAWSIKYFIWSFTNEKIASYISIIPFLFFRLFDKLISEKASWDSASGFYFFGKKDNKYKFYKDDLSNLYKGNQI